MAKTYNSFGQLARIINTATKTGSRKAANNALKETMKSVRTEVKADTGFPAKYVNSKIRTLNATAKIPKASLMIYIKLAISLADEMFKPKEKAVKVAAKKIQGQKGRAKSRIYYGVTVKIGNLARELVPGGFIRQRGKQELVLKREAKAKYPTKLIKTDFFRRAVLAKQKYFSQLLHANFNKLVSQSVDTAIEKRTSSED